MNNALGMTAEDFYVQEQKERTAAVNTARRLADITIPSIFPPEDWQTGDPLAVTNQGVNALAINTLAEKLTITALPPNLPMAKLEPDEAKLADEIQQDPELYAEIIYGLSRREVAHRKRLGRTKARTVYGRAIRQLLVPGNVLVIWAELDNPRWYNMHHYVVKRSASGEPIVTVLKEKIPYATADEDVKQAAQVARTKANKGQFKEDKKWEEEICIYHCQVLEVTEEVDEDGQPIKEWYYWQEVEGGEKISDTEAWAPYDTPTMYAAGMIHETGNDWCQGYASDYEGDHAAVENFASALQDAAAAMAWFLFLVNPGGQTKLKDVKDADNLDIISGQAEDVTVPQTQKASEARFVGEQFGESSRRIGFSYALQTSIQRPGERVTAEEWERMAGELDQVMGGLYTVLAQTFQRWFVLRFIHLHEIEDGSIETLPKELVKVDIVTGLDNIGQSSDLKNLLSWARDSIETVGPEPFSRQINLTNFLSRLASFRAVKTEGLLKSPEEQQADAQAAKQDLQQQTLLEQGTGPLVKSGADTIGKLMQSGMNQPQE